MKDYISSSSLISHSEPDRKLIIHLQEVLKKAQSRLSEININFEQLSVSQEEFCQILKITILCHDVGKSSKYFQDKILRNIDSGRLGEHGLISAFFGYFVSKKLFKLSKNISSYIFIAIRYHHLNLDDATKMQMVSERDYINVFKIFEGMRENFSQIDKIYHYFFEVSNISDKFETFIEKEFNKEELESNYFWNKDKYEENDIFLFMLLFSLLIYADKQDAIYRDDIFYKDNTLYSNSKKVEDFKACFFKDKEITPLDAIREKIYQSIITEFHSKNNIKNKKIYFLKLPTGTGKTLLLYKLAMLINEQKNHAKVFYLLPFITLIEQNATILKDLLDFIGIDTNNNKNFLEKHSLSGEFITEEENRNEYNIDKKQFLLDTLESKYIVTSFHQLFYGIFKRKNALLKRFHQFSNSIILIDEIQLIPLKHIYTISRFLKFMSEIFNCTFVVATATFPHINKKILQKQYTFQDINSILNDDEIDKFFNRYKIAIDIEKAYTYDYLEKKIENKMGLNKDLLFRVNTINTANKIYEYTKVVAQQYEYKISNIFLLTSSIPPFLRKLIIKKIKKNSKKGIKQIVVATQLIQAGVDISLEDGFEELAPLDLLIQSMGRRNRSAEKNSIGKADIIRIINDNGYEGHKIYNNSSIYNTIEILKKYSQINEKQIYEEKLLDTYYAKEPEDKYIEKNLSSLKFKEIHETFNLFEEAPLSFSFFLPLNKRAKMIWKKIEEIDKARNQLIQTKDKYFWKNMKKIDEQYSKIRKDMSQYIVNQNFYYHKDKDKEQVKLIIKNNFANALGIYLATNDIYDNKTGLDLVQYVKKATKGLFW